VKKSLGWKKRKYIKALKARQKVNEKFLSHSKMGGKTAKINNDNINRLNLRIV
jgi:hypothetical protein